MTIERIPIERRFWAKVDKSAAGDCWMWCGAIGNEYGHGVIGRGGRHGGTVPAHRVSWEIHNGAVPDGLCVLHRCDVPACVNPKHLFLGTRPDNMADMTAKGRRASKLTLEQAATIRSSTGPARLIAKQFGVSRSLVSHIRNGRVWKPQECSQ